MQRSDAGLANCDENVLFKARASHPVMCSPRLKCLVVVPDNRAVELQPLACTQQNFNVISAEHTPISHISPIVTGSRGRPTLDLIFALPLLLPQTLKSQGSPRNNGTAQLSAPCKPQVNNTEARVAVPRCSRHSNSAHCAGKALLATGER